MHINDKQNKRVVITECFEKRRIQLPNRPEPDSHIENRFGTDERDGGTSNVLDIENIISPLLLNRLLYFLKFFCPLFVMIEKTNAIALYTFQSLHLLFIVDYLCLFYFADIVLSVRKALAFPESLAY